MVKKTLMFDMAKQYFTDVSRCGDYPYSKYASITNVWSWDLDDTCKLTIVLSPDVNSYSSIDGLPIWIIIENWSGGEGTVSTTWYAINQTDLNYKLDEIHKQYF